jgi:hypothetical protein
MSTLKHRLPKDTYGGLLKVESGGLTTTMQLVEDGFGNPSPLQLATNKIAINNLTFPSSGATPGYVLAVGDDGTSMVWIVAGSSGPSTPTDKGTLKVSDGSSMVDLLVGTNGQVLTADSTTISGMKWATLPSGGGTGDPIPDRTVYTYNNDNAISEVTEFIGEQSRVSTYTYNSNGSINTITISYQGSTRVETYTYVNGQVSTMTSSII